MPADEDRGRRLSERQSNRLEEAAFIETGLKRILVVEDEALLALEISNHLTSELFEVIGPASTVSEALNLLSQFECDAALLDVNLGNETAEAILYELVERDVPFFTMTGYAHNQLPAPFIGYPHLMKPLRYDRLAAELKSLIRSHEQKKALP